MWNKVVEFCQENAPFGILVALAGVFGLSKRMRDIELTCAERGGHLVQMEKQVDWMFNKMGGNGDNPKGD